MYSLSGYLLIPFTHGLVRLAQPLESLTGYKISLYILNILLHLPLMLRHSGPARGNEEAIMFSALPIGNIYGRVVTIPTGFSDGRFQIVRHHSPRHPTEEFESAAV